jgi:dihydrofolate reductase
MSKVIVGMTVSLDGFIQDRHGSVGALYPDLATLRTTVPMQEAIHNTGAVVMGWNAFAIAKDPDLYAGNYEFQVPIFVLTHTVPHRHPKETDQLSFTFVMDGIEQVVQQAKAAAGHKDVTVIGGATTVQQCLHASVVDELHLDMMPVLLGGGRRLFESIARTRSGWSERTWWRSRLAERICASAWYRNGVVRTARHARLRTLVARRVCHTSRRWS